jgi:hypothetical protein
MTEFRQQSKYLPSPRNTVGNIDRDAGPGSAKIIDHGHNPTARGTAIPLAAQPATNHLHVADGAENLPSDKHHVRPRRSNPVDEKNSRRRKAFGHHPGQAVVRSSRFVGRYAKTPTCRGSAPPRAATSKYAGPAHQFSARGQEERPRPSPWMVGGRSTDFSARRLVRFRAETDMVRPAQPTGRSKMTHLSHRQHRIIAAQTDQKLSLEVIR